MTNLGIFCCNGYTDDTELDERKSEDILEMHTERSLMTKV